MSTQPSDNSLPFDDIIGAPLAAIVNSQKMPTQATLEFINALLETHENKQRPKTIDFKIKSNDISSDGTIAESYKDISVPLLSMFKIPHVSVDSAEISLDADVVSHQSESTESTVINTRKLYARYSNTNDQNSTAHIKVKVFVKKENISTEFTNLINTVISEPTLSQDAAETPVTPDDTK